MTEFDLGQVVGDDGVDGATIWVTSTAPTTPNYTFTISNLVGPSGATIKAGDIIIYSYYWYSVTSVSSTTVLAGNRTSIRGATGQNGTDGTNGTNGVGISSITKTSTSGKVDTYTITYTDTNTSTFTVTNGADGNDHVWYGTCSTSATSQVKEVTTSSDYTLSEGTVLLVKFANGQTYAASSSSKLQLKVNGGTNVAVVIGGTNYDTQYHWKSGEMVAFVYDGTNYVIVNEGTASTNYYGVTKLVDSVSSTSTDMSATPNSVKTAYDLANGKADANHNQATSTITNSTAYDNIKSGESTTLTMDTQAKINAGIDTKLGALATLIGSAISYINQ